MIRTRKLARTRLTATLVHRCLGPKEGSESGPSAAFAWLHVRGVRSRFLREAKVPGAHSYAVNSVW